jgi:hypothetical protein
MGILATYFMDFLAKFLIRTKFIEPTVEAEAIERWFLYMFRGKFFNRYLAGRDLPVP